MDDKRHSFVINDVLPVFHASTLLVIYVEVLTVFSVTDVKVC